MPNWCNTNVRFVGAKEDCESAKKVLKDILQRKNGGWLGYINCVLYPEQRPIDKFEELINLPYDHPLGKWDDYPIGDCRGWIQHVYNVYPAPHGNGHILELQVEDAWGPHPELLHLFGMKFNLSLNYAFAEPGMQAFGKYDNDGVFKDYEWFVDINLENEEFCTYGDTTTENILEFYELPDSFKKFVQDNNLELNEDTIEEVSRKFNDTLSGNYDDWFYIFKYGWDDPSLHFEIPEFESVSSTNESL